MVNIIRNLILVSFLAIVSWAGEDIPASSTPASDGSGNISLAAASEFHQRLDTWGKRNGFLIRYLGALAEPQTGLKSKPINNRWYIHRESLQGALANTDILATFDLYSATSKVKDGISISLTQATVLVIVKYQGNVLHPDSSLQDIRKTVTELLKELEKVQLGGVYRPSPP